MLMRTYVATGPLFLSAFERNPECVCGLVETDIRRVWQSYEGLEHLENGLCIMEKADCIPLVSELFGWHFAPMTK